MARSPRQKLKMLYLAQYFMQYTDQEHPAGIRDLIAYLEKQDISAERKSLYDDIEALRMFGLDIIKQNHSRSAGYYLGDRPFEIPELKLMVDSIQTSKFITEKKTLALIRKIEALASVYDAQLLQRQVYVAHRIKHMNESIYYNVDTICAAIAGDRQISFQYFDYNVRKERQLRKDGALYQISPYALHWDDENYYLVAYDTAAGQIKHYRVDKMLHITVTDQPRDGQEAYADLDMGLYAKRVFSMFTGTVEQVQLRFSNQLVGAVLDRFGKEIIIAADGPDHFRCTVEAAVSPQFFAWLFGFGSGVEILGPQSVRDQFCAQLAAVKNQYPQ